MPCMTVYYQVNCPSRSFMSFNILKCLSVHYMPHLCTTGLCLSMPGYLWPQSQQQYPKLTCFKSLVHNSDRFNPINKDSIFLMQERIKSEHLWPREITDGEEHIFSFFKVFAIVETVHSLTYLLSTWVNKEYLHFHLPKYLNLWRELQRGLQKYLRFCSWPSVQFAEQKQGKHYASIGLFHFEWSIEIGSDYELKWPTPYRWRVCHMSTVYTVLVANL